MTKKPNRAERRANKSGQIRTPLSGHLHQDGQLIPPFNQSGKFTLTSWANDRLPEMLWAGLILVFCGRERGLAYLRRIFSFIQKHDQKALLQDISLTKIAALPEELRREFINFILEPVEVKQALSTLLLFNSLPAKEDWKRYIPPLAPNLNLLMDTVGATLWHQSQTSTDCRWVRVMANLTSGKLHFPQGFEEHIKGIVGYPNVGDQKSVRPSIRAMEIAHNPMEMVDLAWPKSFWEEAWLNTPCLELKRAKPNHDKNQENQPKDIETIGAQLSEHWEDTHNTTAIDAKHDGIFGMAFYALRLFGEIQKGSNGGLILGRLGLRTILEVRITLRYLIKTNDEKLWQKWRVYGAGQAKLNALKFDDHVLPPKHIDVASIEEIANEDMWSEFVSINLASWSGLDLRKLSERTDLKDIYDQHYSWTSGYSHGTWGPVREACFTTCGNPLHRLHRYPNQKVLPDIAGDAMALVNDILSDLDAVYPSFPHRL